MTIHFSGEMKIENINHGKLINVTLAILKKVYTKTSKQLD